MKPEPVPRRQSTRQPPEGFVEAFARVAAEPSSHAAWKSLRVIADPPLHNLIVKALGRKYASDADDCLQVLWQRIAARLERTGGQWMPDVPWAYCCKSARNVVIDLANERKRRPPAQDIILSSPDERSSGVPANAATLSESDTDSGLIADDVATFLERSLGARGWAYLSDFVAGYSHAEICATMGMSEEAGRKLKERTVKQAQSLLASLGYRPLLKTSRKAKSERASPPKSSGQP